MKRPHWPIKDPSTQLDPAAESKNTEPSLSELALEPESEAMRRNLSLLRVACESFISTSVENGIATSEDDDRGRVWVYLPALRQAGESDEIRRLASALAGQFGLVASVIVETSSVTVILERRVSA